MKAHDVVVVITLPAASRAPVTLTVYRRPRPSGASGVKVVVRNAGSSVSAPATSVPLGAVNVIWTVPATTGSEKVAVTAVAGSTFVAFVAGRRPVTVGAVTSSRIVVNVHDAGDHHVAGWIARPGHRRRVRRRPSQRSGRSQRQSPRRCVIAQSSGHGACRRRQRQLCGRRDHRFGERRSHDRRHGDVRRAGRGQPTGHRRCRDVRRGPERPRCRRHDVAGRVTPARHRHGVDPIRNERRRRRERHRAGWRVVCQAAGDGTARRRRDDLRRTVDDRLRERRRDGRRISGRWSPRPPATVR